jgi:ribosomal protein L11 methyltransferase
MAVLDVGTGSGILAIAAHLLGAGSVEALDVDPVAVEVARANIAANGVAGARLWVGRLEPGHPGRYDLVVANISTEANIGLAPAFAEVMRTGGVLVLSGILAIDARRVVRAMETVGFVLHAARYERDWCLLELGQALRAAGLNRPGEAAPAPRERARA